VDCCISELTAKTGWLGIRIMYLMGVIYLPVDGCISELTAKTGWLGIRIMYLMGAIYLWTVVSVS
jgi:hypothetical protein